MKKIYLALSAILFSSFVTIAQTPPQLSTVWQYSSSDYIPNASFAQNNFLLLPDSTLVFLTLLSTDRPPFPLFRAAKIGLDGQVIIEHKDLRIPADLQVSQIFLSNLPAGGFLLLAQEDSRRTYIAAYDNEINLIGGKFIDNKGNDPFASRTIESVTALSNGNVVIASQVNLGSSRPFRGNNDVMLVLNAQGDTLFTQSGFWILGLKAGANGTFSTVESNSLECCDKRLRLYSGTNGALVRQVQFPANLFPFSNPSFQPVTNKYRLVTIDQNNRPPYPGPVDLALHTLDDSLNYGGLLSYNQVPGISGLFPFTLQESPDGGYLFYQTGTDDGNKNYIFLGRLDTALQTRWTLETTEPAAIITNLQKIIPLGGNDFLTCTGSDNHDGQVYRFKASLADTASIVRTAVQKKAAAFVQQSPEDENKLPGLSVKVAPNPSATDFTLMLTSTGSQKLRIAVLDAMGRVVEKRSGVPSNGNLQLGGKLPSGIYFVEIVQGDQRRQLRLIKL